MELGPRDYAAEFEHAKASLATRTAEAHSAQATMAHSANHPHLIAMEVRRLKDWIGTVL
jgi:hypothetical protein